MPLQWSANLYSFLLNILEVDIWIFFYKFPFPSQCSKLRRKSLSQIEAEIIIVMPYIHVRTLRVETTSLPLISKTSIRSS